VGLDSPFCSAAIIGTKAYHTFLESISVIWERFSERSLKAVFFTNPSAASALEGCWGKREARRRGAALAGSQGSVKRAAAERALAG
jgi:hypothetical protein